MPAHGGMVHHQYVRSLLGTLAAARERGWSLYWHAPGDYSHIGIARSHITAHFLGRFAKPTHLFRVDADIEWHPRDCLRLVDHDLPPVSAAYPGKAIGGGMIGLALDETPLRDPRTGCFGIR
jgi:hypothetical protein